LRSITSEVNYGRADLDPVALQHFELVPEPVPAEVLGADPEEFSMEVWALRLIGTPLRELLTSEPVGVARSEYVFAVPLDVMRNLARELSRVCDGKHGTAR
jgi:hypothetical protein